MNVIYNYENQHDIHSAKELFQSISSQFHFWKSLLKIEELSYRETEIDLVLSTADYSKDLSSFFKEKKYIYNILSNDLEIEQLISDNLSIIEFLDDHDFFEIFEHNLKIIYDKMDQIYLNSLSKIKYAKNHCYMQFKASTGGTESENLNFIMFKSYLRCFESLNIPIEIIDYEESGNQLLKNAIIKVEKDFAFGLLHSEKGVHRFTRISPYGNGKLHTSFTFIDVYPHIDYETQSSIKKSDLKIDNFRGSGAGGQHRNVTDSAVRITHLPTGIVVKIESERSQHKNKKAALDILAIKLLELEDLKQKESDSKNKGKSNIQDWGRQIRSYTIEQNRIKDHRTNIEYNGTLNNYFNNLYDFILKNNIELNFSC